MVDAKKFAEDEELYGYRIVIQGRNVMVTQAMKNYVFDSLNKIERLGPHIIDVHVNLDIQRVEHSCVIIMMYNQFKIKVSAVSTDMYVSIDRAIDRLQKLIRQWKGKIDDHNQTPLEVIDMEVNVIRRPYNELEEYNAEIEAQNRKEMEREFASEVIAREKRPLKKLRMDEAIMKMELSGDQFLVYRSKEDSKLKVIYRRADGNYGVIQPE